MAVAGLLAAVRSYKAHDLSSIIAANHPPFHPRRPRLGSRLFSRTMANRDSLPPVPPYDDDEDASNGFHQNDFHHNDYDRASPDEPAPAPGLGPVSPVASHHAYDATAAAAQRPSAEVAPAVAKAVDEVLSSDVRFTDFSRLNCALTLHRSESPLCSVV